MDIRKIYNIFYLIKEVEKTREIQYSFFSLNFVLASRNFLKSRSRSSWAACLPSWAISLISKILIPLLKTPVICWSWSAGRGYALLTSRLWKDRNAKFCLWFFKLFSCNWNRLGNRVRLTTRKSVITDLPTRLPTRSFFFVPKNYRITDPVELLYRLLFTGTRLFCRAGR